MRTFREDEVVFSSDHYQLMGAWRRPIDDESFPTALIIGGSGPLDRDGNVKRTLLSVSRDLADLLEQQGWASLRYDKRGVRDSTGDYLSTGFWDEFADAEAAFEWMLRQPGVEASIAIGHSMGASMSAELAARHETLNGIVLLSGIAKTGEDALMWQTEQMKDHLLPRPALAIMKLFRTDLVKQQRKSTSRIKNTDQDVVRVGLAKTNAKWLREMLAYDPIPALRKVAVPTLAITGEKDVQVDVRDLEVVSELVPSAVTLPIPNVDHLLRFESEPVSSPRRYRHQMRKPIDDRVTGAIADWLELTFD